MSPYGPFQLDPFCGSGNKVWLCWSENSWAGLFISRMKHISQPGGEILSAGLCLQKFVEGVLPGHSCQRELNIILHKVQADVVFRLDEAHVNKQEKNLKELLLDRK